MSKNIANNWFTDAEYSKILDNLVIVCVDTLVVDLNGNVLLGKRTKLPIKDWWIFGGRMQASETYEDASVRGIERELKIKVQSKPEFIGYYDLTWSERHEQPNNKGSHVLLAAMIYQVSEDQKLCIKEVPDHEEVRWFSDKQLAQQEINPILKKIIDDAKFIYYPNLKKDSFLDQLAKF